ncbi:transcriptional regulator [Cryptosporangium minutisporangium]|uniref:GAF domain-containing protein n=1 Tax=Cryptosporangium minutisporangium TaxID=113569 RepID=A0ABP6T1N4_9ACTN
MADGDLQARRVQAVRAWALFTEHGDVAAQVRPEILTSWGRSREAHVSTDVEAAPMADESETVAVWKDTPLQTAVEAVEGELRRTAEDGDLVIAVTDADTRILWTYGGRVMRNRAERVGFLPGGRWDDESVGTNALDLANRLDAPSMVFSAEHYARIVANWVCWAAPVHDPVSGRKLGVLDLSTSWDRTHPIGLATARVMARLIETAIPFSTEHPSAQPEQTADPGLVMTLLGTAEARLDGYRLLLSRRQTEVLALLALHPEGLSLEQLHAMVYGDQAITFSTLKAEVSHLRQALGGQLSSRPYRLLMPVATDVQHVLALIRGGHVAAAVDAYGGDLLPGTNSPALSELADYVAVALREALLADPQPDAVLRYSQDLAPYDREVVEACLARLHRAGSGGGPHPAIPLLKARLAVAGR